MIKISLKELHKAKPYLDGLANQFLDLDMSIAIGQVLAVVEQQSKIIDKALVDKAGLLGFALAQSPTEAPKLLEPGKDGFNVPAATIEQFNNDAETFLASSFINLPIDKITRQSLEKSQAKMTPAMIQALGFMFDLFSKEATEESKLKLVKSKKHA